MVLLVLQGVVSALLAVLVIGLLRSHAEVLRRLHELGAGVYEDELPGPGRSPSEIRTRPGGTPAHDLVGVAPSGDTVAVGVRGAPHATLLAFLSSGCATCAGFWDAFAGGAAADLPGEDTRLVIVTKGPEDESVSEVRARAVAIPVTTVMSNRAFDDYGVPVNPYFILVDGPGERIIGEGAAATWAQVADLLGRAAADHGATLDLRDSRGRDALAEAELAAAGIGPGHPSLHAVAPLADDGEQRR
jgi:hypothetical protein